MSEETQKRIFSNNLNHILLKRHKSQKEVADAIGVSAQTFNTWCRGIALPRMGKLQKLADYLMLNKSDLIEEHKEDSEKSSTLTPEGYQIGLAYDNADYITKRMVERSLGLESEKEKEEDSCTG